MYKQVKIWLLRILSLPVLILLTSQFTGCPENLKSYSIVTGDCWIKIVSSEITPKYLTMTENETKVVDHIVYASSNCEEFIKTMLFDITETADLMVTANPDTVYVSGVYSGETFIEIKVPMGTTKGLKNVIIRSEARSKYLVLEERYIFDEIIDTIYVNVTDFSFSLSPPNQAIIPGYTGTVDINITRAPGFTDPINFTLEGGNGIIGQGAGKIDTTFTPNPVTGDSSSLTLSVGANVPAGDYSLTVKGTAGGEVVTVPLFLTVNSSNPEFTMSLSQPTITIMQNDSATIDVNFVKGPDFSKNISLAVEENTGIIGPGPYTVDTTFTPNPVPVNINTSALQLNVGSNAPVGTYSLNIKGFTDNDQKTAVLTLNVIPFPHFNVSLSKNNVILGQGESDTLTVFINRISGYSDPVYLYCEAVPSDVQWSFNPAVVTVNDPYSILTLTADNNAFVASYSSTVKAESGPYEIYTDFVLTIEEQGAIWQLLSSGEYNPLYGVYFTDADYGFAVGGGGTVLKTTNGGTDWSETNLGSILSTFNDVQFFNQTEGIIVGLFNEIYYTSNGGISWEERFYTLASAGFQGVSFPDNQNGWIAGTVIAYTPDAGINWYQQVPPDPSVVWLDIVMTDNNGDYNGAVVGVINGAAGIIKYSPHGESWVTSNIPAGTLKLNGICAVNPTTFYAASFDGKILKSTDSGINWTEVSSVPDIIQNISASDENNLWVAGNEIYHSSDGGQTWTEELSLNNNSFYDVIMIPNTGTGYSVGGFNSGIIYTRK